LRNVGFVNIPPVQLTDGPSENHQGCQQGTANEFALHQASPLI
jgi:hypothetical protein